MVDFEELNDDAPLDLIPGVQGGHHFIVHARIQGLIPGDPSSPGLLGNPITVFRLFREDGTEIQHPAPPYRLGYRPEPDDWFALASGRILRVSQDLIDNENLLEEIYSERIRMRVEVHDARGYGAAAEVWIRPREVREEE